jgi:hypothetical protein
MSIAADFYIAFVTHDYQYFNNNRRQIRLEYDNPAVYCDGNLNVYDILAKNKNPAHYESLYYLIDKEIININKECITINGKQCLIFAIMDNMIEYNPYIVSHIGQIIGRMRYKSVTMAINIDGKTILQTWANTYRRLIT